MVVLAIVAACSQSPMDPGVGESEGSLHFLSPNASAPSIGGRSSSFYAVNRQTREGALFYHQEAGDDDSVRLADLLVPAGALTTRPDGSTIAPGDSLLITISIVDSLRLIVGFQPSGLQFSSGKPAILTMSFVEADSSITPSEEGQLALWRQEQPGGLWYKVPNSLVLPSQQAVQAGIPGFSVYASAY
jgi:hypothetical protein